MKRAAKSLLLAAGIIGLVCIVINLTVISFISLYLNAAGLSLSISGFANYYAFNPEYMSESSLQSYLVMMIVGIALIIVINVIFFVQSLALMGLLIVSILAIICAGALSDKKGGYIVALVFGILTLLTSFIATGLLGGFVGLLMIIGAILGMVALKKEKKQFKAVR